MSPPNSNSTNANNPSNNTSNVNPFLPPQHEENEGRVLYRNFFHRRTEAPWYMGGRSTYFFEYLAVDNMALYKNELSRKTTSELEKINETWKRRLDEDFNRTKADNWKRGTLERNEEKLRIRALVQEKKGELQKLKDKISTTQLKIKKITE